MDSHNFPNLPLMKLSAYYKAQGHHVDWWNGFQHYDVVYKSKVFTEEYSHDDDTVIHADRIVCGGTGYDLENRLPDAVEHIYPDYSLYPKYSANAYGFLTRGCPRACRFCIVAQKEGRVSRQVATLDSFWRGQQSAELLDPNILACRDHELLLEQLISTGVWINFNQGLDIRFVNEDNIKLLDRIKMKRLHFAWDNPAEDLTSTFVRYKALTEKKKREAFVYVLTNFNSTHEQDLHRIYTLRDIGFNPYVTIFNKSSAPPATRRLQRWVNNKFIFRSVKDFSDYKA